MFILSKPQAKHLVKRLKNEKYFFHFFNLKLVAIYFANRPSVKCYAYAKHIILEYDWTLETSHHKNGINVSNNDYTN